MDYSEPVFIISIVSVCFGILSFVAHYIFHFDNIVHIDNYEHIEPCTSDETVVQVAPTAI